MSDASRYGFRVVGSCESRRRLVEFDAAFAAYCRCDPAAEIDRESYLSAFTFPSEFRRHLDAVGSTRGYSGRCASRWLWLDIDRKDDLDAAVNDARRLVAFCLRRYATLDEGAVLVFWSGGKGLHIGLPLGMPTPSLDFAAVAKRLAVDLAEHADAVIDCGVYDRVRSLRGPNSRHPRTGLCKRRLSLDELLRLPARRLAELARTPLPFDPPAVSTIDPTLAGDLEQARLIVEHEATVKAQRRAATAAGEGRLTRRTLQTIRGENLDVGDRHRLLFSAAANLAELGCPVALAIELLIEVGLDCGLPPSDVRRQIECGLSHGSTLPEGGTP